MGTTPKGFRYPDGTARPATTAISNLATDVDSYLTARENADSAAANAAWVQTTPAWQQASDNANLNIGNGLMWFRHRIIGKTLFGRFAWQRGSTTNTGVAGAQYKWTLASGVPAPRGWQESGPALLIATGIWIGAAHFINSTGTFVILMQGSSGVPARLGQSGRPDGTTWASGDVATCHFMYEIA